MWKALLITFIIVGAFAADENPEVNNETKEKTSGVKEETASGVYYGGNAGYGYQPPPPPPPYGFPPPPPYGFAPPPPPLVDDYVCDIDASILVVTNVENADEGYGNKGYGNNNDNYGNNNNNPYGGHHHHHHHHHQKNADRLKCAVIANYDENTCTSCCRIAARRDRSVPEKSVVGFIVDESQLDYEQNDQPNQPGPYRMKRAAPPPENYGVPGAVPPPRAQAPPPPVSTRPVSYYPPPPTVIVASGNSLGPKARCVCCAPRKFGFPHFAPPRYY